MNLASYFVTPIIGTLRDEWRDNESSEALQIYSAGSRDIDWLCHNGTVEFVPKQVYLRFSNARCMVPLKRCRDRCQNPYTTVVAVGLYWANL